MAMLGPRARLALAPLALALAASAAQQQAHGGDPTAVGGAATGAAVEPAGGAEPAAVAAVRGLLRRRLPTHAEKFELRVNAPPTASPLQQSFVVGAGSAAGTVALAGSSGVALAGALNHYLKYDCGAQVNVWFTSQTALPPELPAPTPANVTSPYTFQNYLNICAFGYSTPFWHWERWQDEVDWMALNGVLNPLAMVGQDALWLDTFVQDFGLPREELLSEFFAGPTFQPWHWMGNLNGWGGPVDEQFLRQQLALQKNVTAAMTAFGMRPVLPAFAGHVPRAMAAKFPDANVTQLAPWHGHMPNGTFFLSPSSPLFHEIGKKFVARQAEALGVQSWSPPHYYLADAYNEMPPPVTEPTFLASVSKALFDSMQAADSDALMVTQGWFLSNVPRMPWGHDQARAFLHGPPQGKLLVLDLNAIENPVWNRTQSFYGVPFALCMLHNFGERPGLFGRLPDAAAAPPATLHASAPGTMVGTGMTPEGIQTNPIIYDLYAEMFWNGRTAPDVDEWVQRYAARRYGLGVAGRGSCTPHANTAWALLQGSVYSAPRQIAGEQGATASDMAARPNMAGGRIPDTVDRAFYDESDVENAWSELLKCASALGDDVDGYAYDLVAVGRQVMSDRFNALRVEFAHAATAAARQAAGAPRDAAEVKAGASPAWHCVHFSGSDDAKCKGLTGAKQLACQAQVCVGKGGNFSHDDHHNSKFPGCGTCWCCAVGAGPAPPTPPPPAPIDLAAAKRLGAELLELIDDMDKLLATHHAFLLGTWLHDAEGWAAQASSQAHATLLMQDARRLITLWGHPDSKSDTHDSGLSQYSYRLWAGLVRSFYRPRWEDFVSTVVATLSAGRPFDKAAQAQLTQRLTWWEEGWVSNASITARSVGTQPQGSSTAVALELCRKYVANCGSSIEVPIKVDDEVAEMTEVACDVVIIGGSVASFSAALAAAADNSSVCLLEPTDWVGGQMTSAGVPALDFAPEGYPTKFGETSDTVEKNLPPALWRLLSKLRKPNYVTCWVSPFCFLPTALLAEALGPMAAAAATKLRVFYETLPVKATTSEDGASIQTLQAVQRTPRSTTECGGYDAPPSAQIEDWYDPQPSGRFDKRVLLFAAPVWIDASYSGDLLALSRAPFLQGADEAYDGDVRGDAGDGTLGQAAILTTQIAMAAEPVSPPEPPTPVKPWAAWGVNPFSYADDLYWGTFNLSFPEFWTRRRSYASGVGASTAAPDRTQQLGSNARLGNFHPPPVNIVSPGDISLMVWHDYYWGFLFVSKAATREQASSGQWRGGYNLSTLRGAEDYALLAYEHFKSKAPPGWRAQMKLDSTHLGTCTGMAKMPYVRDGRRSIGLAKFTMNITAKAIVPGTPVATPWPDRVAIVQHGLDMWGHRQMPFSDDYPPYIAKMSAWCNTGHFGPNVPSCTPGEKFGCPCVPAFLPYRALTNDKVRNLVVGGLAMAQSYMVNSAIRMHPTEWISGTAAGVVAAYMQRNRVADTARLLEGGRLPPALEAALRRQTPLEWTIGGKRWPPA